MSQTQNKKVSEVLDEFLKGINSFDEENSIQKYDKACIQDAVLIVKRIESIREIAKSHGDYKN